MRDIENLEPNELIEALETWHECDYGYKDNSLDARVLRKAINTILQLLEENNNLQDTIDKFSHE